MYLIMTTSVVSSSGVGLAHHGNGKKASIIAEAGAAFAGLGRPLCNWKVWLLGCFLSDLSFRDWRQDLLPRGAACAQGLSLLFFCWLILQLS